jgi:hypothetical protein
MASWKNSKYPFHFLDSYQFFKQPGCQDVCKKICLGAMGFEPMRISASDFEADAITNSAKPL